MQRSGVLARYMIKSVYPKAKKEFAMSSNNQTLQMIAGVMTEASWESPLTRYVFQGVRDPETCLFQYSVATADHYARNYDLKLGLKDGRAFLLGRDTANANKWADFLFQARLFFHSMQLLSIKEFWRIARRKSKSECLLASDWHKAFVEGRHYKIEVIGFSKEMHDFRLLKKMLCSRIQYCEKHKIPMVVATSRVQIAETLCELGFNLLRTAENSNAQCTQYGLIRWPQGHSIIDNAA